MFGRHTSSEASFSRQASAQEVSGRRAFRTRDHPVVEPPQRQDGRVIGLQSGEALFSRLPFIQAMSGRRASSEAPISHHHASNEAPFSLLTSIIEVESSRQSLQRGGPVRSGHRCGRCRSKLP